MVVGNKNNKTSGFSWADEVEKEETQICHQQKPNPFGFARPREIVLQEKGVHWRNLDQKIHQTSNFSYVAKKEKENIPAQTELVNGKQNSEKGHNQRRNQFNYETIQNQQDLLVPPLMYPPKNYMFLINDRYGSNHSHKSEQISPNFHNPSIDKSIRENQRQNSIVKESTNHQLRRSESSNLIMKEHSSAQKRERETQNMNSNSKRRNFSEEKIMAPSNLPPLQPTINKGSRNFEYQKRKLDSREFDFPPMLRRQGGGNCKDIGMNSGFNNTKNQQYQKVRR